MVSRFHGIPEQDIFFVTVLVGLEDRLLPGVHWMAGEPALVGRMGKLVASLRKRLSRSLDHYVAFGGVELSVPRLDRAAGFASDWRAAGDYDVMSVTADPFHLQLHFCFAGYRDGTALDAGGVGGFFRRTFPLRHQVVVKPLRGDPSEHLPRLASYGCKFFVDGMSDGRVRELHEFCRRVPVSFWEFGLGTRESKRNRRR
jgi:hypothetical protein